MRNSRRDNRKPREPKEFDEKVIKISRVSKKTKGGNKIGFTALVVIGDRKGRVGVALGKANDVVSAIKKGIRKAKKKLITVPLHKNSIPHEIVIKSGAARLIIKPAPEGTGIIAGGSVRSVLELAGVRNVVAKVLGTNNKLSNVNTTFLALNQIKDIVATKKKLGQTNITTSTSTKVKEPDVKKDSKTKVKKVVAKKPVTKKSTTKKPVKKSAKKATIKKAKSIKK